MRRSRLILFAFLCALLLGGSLRFAPVTYASLGYVGNMYPSGGSSSTITAGQTFDVYLQVWKNGVTPGGGQGAGITCTLHWAQVSSFGGSWSNITHTPMSYNVDIGNNDEYRGTISPAAGLYEFTAYCTDTTDNSSTYQGSGNGRLTVNPGAIAPTGTRALWVEEGKIAWNHSGATTYELHHDFAGNLSVPQSAGSGIALTSAGQATSTTYGKFPNIAGYDLWQIPAGQLSQIPTILKSEMAIAAYNSGGTIVASTRLQIQGVLDDLYSYGGDLGLTYDSGAPTVRLWAPTARSVTLRRFDDATTATYASHPMTLDAASGVWSVAGSSDWDRDYYLFDVEVFVQESGNVEHNVVPDPYSVNLSQNSTRSQFVDLYGDPSLEPADWQSFSKPELAAPEDISVYEVHVRDFSINDLTVTDAAHRGTFKAFAYDGAGPNPNSVLSDGMAHLLALAEAGLTHLHLLPVFDIASVNEDASARAEPDPASVADTGRASDDQQAEVGAHRATDGFNWGYDPYHFGVPEGSYATAQNDTTRIVEFREMVQTLNGNGLRVVMDVVYNHTHAAGQDGTSTFDKIVPGYYHRYSSDGTLQTSSCCADTAAEFDMVTKLMVDTLKTWAVAYKVDSFRFDLMNLHPTSTMSEVSDALQALTVAEDGVDGSAIYLYGEGWDFGSASDKGLEHATQFAMAGTGIGTFNDRIRDAAHGGFNTDSTAIRTQGFINGLSYDWNGYCYSSRTQGDLRYQTDRLRVGLAGNLQNYPFTDQNGNLQTGIGLGGTGYTLDPQEHVPYISKHDNETLFDLNVFKLPYGYSSDCAAFTAPTTPMAERVRVQNMGLSLVGLSQGVPFFHLGSDMLRSKSLDRNSYDSGDWFNRVDFTYTDNNFGVGLPPAWDNASRWPIMTPLLSDTSLDPSQSEILDNVEHFREILRIRSSSPLFRLRTASEINERLNFYNTGPSQQDGLIVMTLSDAVGADLDPDYEFLVVLFNANKVQQSFTIGSLAGLPFELHPVLTDAVDADPTVQGASFNGSTGAFTIPARTTAVFVSETAPAASGDLDFVGDMYPNGGSSTALEVGDPTDLAVYVQVYEAGVTPGAGQGADIQCYLHWGEYGSTWSDLPMSYNAGFTGNTSNDEYFATISTDDLAVGTYGFTSYCTRDGGATKTWQGAGDGLLSITPSATPDPLPAPSGGVFVHLFEWRWADIEKECSYLAAKGYDAVQVSPPQEHVIPTADMGGPDNDYPWWVRYQPVTHDTSPSTFVSRSGTLAEFQSMVDSCNAEGVAIYVDAVINHTTGVGSGTGTAGSTYTAYDYPQYDPADFHACGTTGNEIENYSNRSQVQTCELVNLADLDTGQEDVRATLHGYLQALLDMGVAGFRIDAAKHIATYDIEAILEGLTLAPELGGGEPYIFQEVIEASGEPVAGHEYFLNGDVTEFDYSQQIGAAFNQCSSNLAALETFGSGASFMPSPFAVVFTDNHDNQRGHGAGGACVLDHRDGDALYNLGNIFLLGHPYGYSQVMSSYYWDGTHDSYGPPSTTGGAGSGPDTLPVYGDGQEAGDTPEHCADGTNWVCEHRRTAIANMVRFREVTAGEPLTDWWDNGANQIAFGRGDKGFVAINREATTLTHAFGSSMPAGLYCDVTQGELNAEGTGCTGPSLAVESDGTINATVAAMGAFAIHESAKVAPTLSVSSGASSVAAGGSTPINATLQPQAGESVADLTITFTILSGGGSLSSSSASTNSSGIATVTLNAPAAQDEVVVQAAFTAPTGHEIADVITIYVGYEAEVTEQETVQTDAGSQQVGDTDTLNVEVIKEGSGQPTISLAKFAASPVALDVTPSYSPYVDVHLDATTGVTSLQITVHYTEDEEEATHALWWWNGSMWAQVNETVTRDTTANTLSFTVTASSTPSLSQLTGTPFVTSESAPAAVPLAGLSATAAGEQVIVEWETASEQEILGFNLLRGESLTGPVVPLNVQMIPAQAPGSSIGSSYQWEDETVEAGRTYFYWVEALAFDGSPTRHGPATATAARPLVATIRLAYRWNTGDSGSETVQLFQGGQFSDSRGASGTWRFQAGSRRLLLQYAPGHLCAARLTGHTAATGRAGGTLACQDGSGMRGVWVGTVAWQR